LRPLRRVRPPSERLSQPLSHLANLEADIGLSLRQITAKFAKQPNMKVDERGFWSDTGTSPPPTDISWKTTEFCHNCSKSGHTERDCMKIPFQTLATIMNMYFDRNPRISADNIEDFFWDHWQ
jgi:hypothetical protein